MDAGPTEGEPGPAVQPLTGGLAIDDGASMTRGAGVTITSCDNGQSPPASGPDRSRRRHRVPVRLRGSPAGSDAITWSRHADRTRTRIATACARESRRGAPSIDAVKVGRAHAEPRAGRWGARGNHEKTAAWRGDRAGGLRVDRRAPQMRHQRSHFSKPLWGDGSPRVGRLLPGTRRP